MDPTSFTVDFRKSVLAAVLLWALEILRGLKFKPLRTVTEVLTVTGSGKSQAYEMLSRLKDAAATLERRSGRPVTTAPDEVVLDLVSATRDFLMDHPGAIQKRGARKVYQDSFRCFALTQLDPGKPAAQLTVEQAAQALGIPPDTLKDWLRAPAKKKSATEGTRQGTS